VSEQEQILRLGAAGLGTRQIAKQVERSRYSVRRVLLRAGRLSSDTEPKAAKASKLDPFRALIEEKVGRGLTTTRILRELREQGYTGGRSILARWVRTLRAPLAPRKSRKVTRRFETGPAEEIQVDWSTYRMQIGGATRIVQALCLVLAHSRKAWLVFYESQRMSRLLEGLSGGFEAFEGVTRRVVYDNMSTIVLGRVGRERKPIWNEEHLTFARHYAFEPYLCQVASPDRKGEVEAFLGYAERDFVRGLEPASFAELNRLCQRWLDEVANKRVHGTTGLVPDEAWLAEKDFLIALPERRYAGACDVEYRKVAGDSTVSIRSVRYTVPVRLAHRQVRVRLYAERFAVLDRDGSVALGRDYLDPSQASRLVIDSSHYGEFKRGPDPSGGRTRKLEQSFVLRWPQLEGFLTELKLRMKNLVHVDLRKLARLAERYGDEALGEAALRAHDAGRHTAGAVERILERSYPRTDDEPLLPLGAEARAQALLDDVEEGSLDHFAHLDTVDPEEAEGGELNGEVPCGA
jgi:transposase